jgi:hypothetical protein
MSPTPLVQQNVGGKGAIVTRKEWERQPGQGRSSGALASPSVACPS